MLINKTSNPDLILQSTINKELKTIAEKVFAGERISNNEGIYLYEHAELGYLGVLAEHVKKQKSGDYVYFNRNFHVEPTNVCVYTCSFCAYSRLIKNREEGWELSIDEIMDIIKKYDGQDVTEVHITGGVIPKQNWKHAGWRR